VTKTHTSQACLYTAYSRPARKKIMSVRAGHTDSTNRLSTVGRDYLLATPRFGYSVYVKKYSEVVRKWDFGN